MDYVQEFLDSSTIHGLSRISQTRRCSRLFWIFVVIAAFSGAVFLIWTSFLTWSQNPITTTIETLPISQIQFPNVTVCPPEGSFLNLNPDIIQSKNVHLDNRTRNELLDYALNLIQWNFYIEMLTNLSKVHDPARYHNWYHGYSQINFPYYNDYMKQLSYTLASSANAGNISTQHFGKEFNSDRVDGFIYISTDIYYPESVKNDPNITLMINVFKGRKKRVYSFMI